MLQVLEKRHRLLHHFLVQLGSVQQMQLSTFPNGKAKMGNIESFLITSDGDDISITHNLFQLSRIPNSTLRDIPEAGTCYTLLHLTDFSHVLRMVAQGLIAFWIT